MDETTQYNCNKIFNISNHIYNCIKRPQGMQIDYTSIKSIWVSFIGINITLSQEEFNDLNNKCLHLKSLLDKIDNIIGIIKALDINQKCDYINKNVDLFDIFFNDLNNVIECINKDIQYLKTKNVIRSNIIPEKDNITKGTKWINTLFNFYLKYEGKKKVSTSEFFYHIRDIWDKIDNDESLEITHIIDNILGGGSINNISHNLRDWLIKNGDIMYRDIIDTSIEPKDFELLDFEVIEFDPNEYVTLS